MSDATGVLEHRLAWMSPRAPYMPVASVGLLEALRERDPYAAFGWQASAGSYAPPELALRSSLSLDEVAQAIAEAPWPELGSLQWSAKQEQAIKPTLQGVIDQDGDDMAGVREWRRLAGIPPDKGPSLNGDARAAQRLVGALLTDGAVDGNHLPGRNRLLRGVKSDLSGVANPPKADPAELARELSDGPQWTSGSSGLALGLAPQAQTFGGTTGPTPSAVGSYSKLLYRLCWLGIMAMPPFGVLRGWQAVVGGPLFAAPDTMSWPVWTIPLRRKALVALFGLAPVHEADPNRELLRAHGIQAVFRSRAKEINTMIAVFGWGDRVG